MMGRVRSNAPRRYRRPDVQNLVDIGRCAVLEALLDGVSSIVDQDVDRPVTCLDIASEGCDCAHGRQVHHFPGRAFNLARGTFQHFGTASREDDLGASDRHGLGDGGKRQESGAGDGEKSSAIHGPCFLMFFVVKS
jgi:hypothetical protein